MEIGNNLFRKTRAIRFLVKEFLNCDYNQNKKGYIESFKLKRNVDSNLRVFKLNNVESETRTRGPLDNLR